MMHCAKYDSNECFIASYVFSGVQVKIASERILCSSWNFTIL